MSGVEHERHRQRLDGMKGSQKEVYGHKFHRARKDGQAHQAGIPEAEAGNIHIDSIGHSQKQKACQNGNGVGKGGIQRLFENFSFVLHKLSSNA